MNDTRLSSCGCHTSESLPHPSHCNKVASLVVVFTSLPIGSSQWESCSCTPVQRVLYFSACLSAGLGERHLGRHTCSGPNVLEQRRQKQDVISEISHTLLCSTVLLLVLLAARWWTFGVSTRVLGFFWDSCDLSFSYNSCFLFGFFMVWIWNVVFLPSIPALFCPIYLGFSFTSLDCMCVYDLFLPLSCGFPVRSLSVEGLVCRFFLWILTFWTLPK